MDVKRSQTSTFCVRYLPPQAGRFCHGKKPMAEPLSIFEQFYSRQKLFKDLSDDDAKLEWRKVLESLKTPLPVTFRWNDADDFHGKVNQEKVSCLRILSDSGINVKKLSFTSAWQLSVDANTLGERKGSKALRWIVAATRSGIISRQEVASMIPVALLDVQPGHRVLDMCASPGSKTRQALERLCKGIAAVDEDDTGLVIANDCNLKRSFVIANRCNVLGLNTQRLAVIHHKGQRIPNVAIEASSMSSTLQARSGRNAIVVEEGQFDRIICDVPCSGDGTIRKDNIVWHRWHPEFSMELHVLQVQIAMRGISLLKVGGIMAYSTCTFSPLEDEAVVSELLRRCGNAIELVKCELPNFRCGKGISKWAVLNDDLEELSLEDVPNQKILATSMFPSGQKHLSRCLRVFPHYEDTGGFFICLLRKVKPLPPLQQTGKSGNRSECGRAKRSRLYKQNLEEARMHSRVMNGQHFYPLPENLQQDLRRCYTSSFVRRARLFSRSGMYNSVSLTSNNLAKYCFEHPGSNRLHIVSAGFCCFEKRQGKASNKRGMDAVESMEGVSVYRPHRKLRKRVMKQVHGLSRHEDKTCEFV